MRIYRNEYKVDGESQGFEFYTTKAAAGAARTVFERQNAQYDCECIQMHTDVDLTRGGVLSLLRNWASHADNG